MSRACTPILVGVASSVLEILLLAKMAKFPFPTMDYIPFINLLFLLFSSLLLVHFHQLIVIIIS